MKKDVSWHLNKLKKSSKESIKAMKAFTPNLSPRMKMAKGEVVGYIDAYEEIIKEINTMQRAIRQKKARLKVKLK